VIVGDVDAHMHGVGGGTLIEPVGADFAVNSSNIEVVDASRFSIVVFAPNGALQAEYPLPLTGVPESAVRIGYAWFIGQRSTDGGYRIDAVDGRHPTSSLSILRASRNPRDSATSGTLMLSVVRGDLLVTRLFAPFKSVRLTSRGDTVLVFESPPIGSQRQWLGRRSTARWIGLPIIALDSGYLQTFSDVKSDRRLLVRYAADGRIRRITRLDAPIGVVAADPDHDLLFAVRTVGTAELVRYKWTWR
jgi:hypothetical protein